MRCSVLQCVAVCYDTRATLVYMSQPPVRTHCTLYAVCCSVLQCVAVCRSVLQCVAVCCSVLQCVAVCCSTLFVRKRLAATMSGLILLQCVAV